MKSKLKGCWWSIVPLHIRDESSTGFCVFPRVKSGDYSSTDTPVYLNIYDLSPANGYFYWAGFGAFHSGVEVHGVEYAFGAHEYPTSGVFEVEPRQCPGFRFRKSVFMGTTRLDHNQIREFMEHQSANYNGDTYHLVVKNCNHFCEDICVGLTGNRIPKWVNRLARLGSYCNSILPEAFKTSTLCRDADHQDTDGEKKKMRRSVSCFSSLSMPPLFLHSHYNG